MQRTNRRRRAHLAGLAVALIGMVSCSGDPAPTSAPTTTVRTGPIVASGADFLRIMADKNVTSLEFRETPTSAPGSLAWIVGTAKGQKGGDGSTVEIDIHVWDSVANALAATERTKAVGVPGIDESCGNVTLSFTSVTAELANDGAAPINVVRDALSSAGYPC